MWAPVDQKAGYDGDHHSTATGDSNQALIRRTLGVVLERTVRELNGVPCISLDMLLAEQQSIVSRSFARYAAAEYALGGVPVRRAGR